VGLAHKAAADHRHIQCLGHDCLPIIVLLTLSICINLKNT
jgi:hypothetical protein